MRLKPSKTGRVTGRVWVWNQKYDQVGLSSGADLDPVLRVEYKHAPQPVNLDLLLMLVIACTIGKDLKQHFVVNQLHV
jgi:hypothetical protein